MVPPVTRLLRGLVLALALLPACAPTINLTSPDRPRFAGNYGLARFPAGEDVRPGRITVVTFNLKYGLHPDRAIQVLSAPPLRTADIISLQEVDEVATERIARALQFNYIYYPSVVHPVRGRNFGPALLSRWPIERDWKVLLPHRSWFRGQRRSATGAIITVGRQRLRVYAVHLELPVRLSPGDRTEQIAALLCDAEDAAEPVVIAGDMNGHDIVPDFLAAGYQWLTRAGVRSSALFHLDEIFVRGLAPVERNASGAVKDVRGASDHRPVWAALELPAEPGQVTLPRPRLPACRR